MYKKFICFLLLGIQSVGFSIVPTQNGLVEENSASAFEMFSHLKEEKSSNLIFSPYGVTTALAVLYLGSRQQTYHQMSRVLHFPLDQKSFLMLFKNLNNEIFKTDDKIQLKMVNALWIQNHFPLNEEYIQEVNTLYPSHLEEVDFINHKKDTVQKINQWVKNNSNDKILAFLQESELTSSTKMLLTNVICFNGSWKSTFDKDLTQLAEFFVSESILPVEVEMMHQKGYFNLARDLNLSMIELPYLGKEIEMQCYILLPDREIELVDIEKEINLALLFDLKNRMQRRYVDLHLPKFKIESRLNLSPFLRKMGLLLPFTELANFSGINSKTDLYLSKIFQQASIVVDEQGTEATAATGAGMSTTSFKENELAELFKVDRPFLFLLQDKKTQSILFIGKVINPKI